MLDANVVIFFLKNKKRGERTLPLNKYLKYVTLEIVISLQLSPP